jgi:outer membrane biosynthesis protein TonB
MPRPAVTFLATVDEQGNVIHVDLYHTSGSDNIDLPCEEALNQWKIEPSKDRNGRPVRDVVSITFVLY